ncbi:MAG: hypothetical protein O2820_21150 [Planctomycetota bacterium]|nr:hypothetical protein [Planctomycetota bacterium]MDA1251723.1 hypothetical protein [Planctomycetota bacterium]
MSDLARRFVEHLQNLYGRPLTRSLKFSLIVCGTLALCLFGGLVVVAVNISSIGN